MKLNCCLILGTLFAVSASAQNTNNALPPIPPPVVGSPAILSAPAPEKISAPAAPAAKKKAPAKAKTKPAPKKPALVEAPATLAAGPAEVVVNRVNVRGLAGLKGEVIGRVSKGETVNVLEQINLAKHKADEPSQWAKISLPTNVAVWVNSQFIDAKSKTVKPKKLNLRSGPGEHYNVLGVIDAGTAITETGSKGEWTKIEAPSSSYAFVAAMYLKQEATGNIPKNPAPSTETPEPTPTTVAEPTPIVTAPAEPIVTPPAVVTPPTVIVQTNIIVVADTNLPPPPPRVVTHEGVVRKSISIVAPTYFELYYPPTGEVVNYLFSTTTNLNLARYNGFHISVTGEEGLDARWRKSPVLTVQKIYVLSTNGFAAPAEPVPAADPKKKSKPWYRFGL